MINENLVCLLNGIYYRIRSGLKSKKGQTLVEYALLLMLIAVVVIAAVTVVGQKACNLYSNIGSNIPS
jgi:pilus assembly protein Flp/PilA